MKPDRKSALAGIWLDVAPVHTLRSGDLTLCFSPGAGGRITSLHARDHAGGRHDWLMPMAHDALQAGFDGHAWPKAGCYPLLPFSNRIRDGRFIWDGREIQLAPHPGQPHAMHGLAHARAWQLDSLTDTDAVISLRHLPGSKDWPWPFTATQTFALRPHGLTASMTLRNDGAGPMPAGGGFHPFFPRPDGSRVQFAASHLWPADASGVATSRRGLLPVEDYRVPRALPAAEWTGYFSGWDGEARLLAPGRPALMLRARAPLTHLVVYAPEGRDFCAVEPVSHVADAVNLHQQGLPDTGLCELEPGASLRFEMLLQAG